MRGPHDDEIEDPDPGNDHARERLDDFLKRRAPHFKPEERETRTGGESLHTPDSKPDPKP